MVFGWVRKRRHKSFLEGIQNDQNLKLSYKEGVLINSVPLNRLFIKIKSKNLISNQFLEEGKTLDETLGSLQAIIAFNETLKDKRRNSREKISAGNNIGNSINSFKSQLQKLNEIIRKMRISNIGPKEGESRSKLQADFAIVQKALEKSGGKLADIQGDNFPDEVKNASKTLIETYYEVIDDAFLCINNKSVNIRGFGEMKQSIESLRKFYSLLEELLSEKTMKVQNYDKLDKNSVNNLLSSLIKLKDLLEDLRKLLIRLKEYYTNYYNSFGEFSNSINNSIRIRETGGNLEIRAEGEDGRAIFSTYGIDNNLIAIILEGDTTKTQYLNFKGALERLKKLGPGNANLLTIQELIFLFFIRSLTVSVSGNKILLTGPNESLFEKKVMYEEKLTYSKKGGFYYDLTLESRERTRIYLAYSNNLRKAESLRWFSFPNPLKIGPEFYCEGVPVSISHPDKGFYTLYKKLK